MLSEKIEIYLPQALLPLNQRIQGFIPFLEDLTRNELRDFYTGFTGNPPLAKNKSNLILKCAEALAFPTIEDFKAWFGHLPPVGQRILQRLVRDEYIPVMLIEETLDDTIIKVNATYSWNKRYSIDPALQLSFLNLDRVEEYFVLFIAPVFRKALLPWLVPAPDPAECALEAAPAEFWSNRVGVADSFPLLCESLRELLPHSFSEGMTHEKLLRGGFKKKELNALRASSGFPSFGHKDAPDSVDMTARFILCMTNFGPVRPPDGQEALRDLITDFFSTKTRFNDYMTPPDRKYLEFNLFTDHLSRTPGYYLDSNNRELPLSRIIFGDILKILAKDDRWFDSSALGDYIRQSGRFFSFCNASLERTLKLKADTLEIDGVTYEHQYEYYSDFNVQGFFRHELLVKPVFKAYCFLFAALGILDISLKDPPLCRHYREKDLPVSPYDSLGAVRITEFGRWCLRLTDKQPPQPERHYQAIADRELYLVTVQGTSLERQVYLDRIGVKLGEDRWRISPASFIAGCENRQQIEERISRFKLLIDPAPAPHWEALFDKVLSRAGLFDGQRVEFLTYKLPEDRFLVEELLSDPALKQIALRAEGKLLVVPVKNYRKFLSFLSDHGVSSFT